MNAGKEYRMYTQHNHEELSSEGTTNWTLMSEIPPNLVPVYIPTAHMSTLQYYL